MSENEFQVQPDTPEAYEQDALLHGPGMNEDVPPVDVPTPPVDDISSEASASDTPAAPVAPVVSPAPVATAAPVEQKPFNRLAPIHGMKEDPGTSIEGPALATKEKLSKEPKVRMMIPLDPGEKAGAYRTVIINGYRFDVRKNTMVDLPQSVANLLASAYRITSEVLEDNPLNLNRADAEARAALDA